MKKFVRPFLAIIILMFSFPVIKAQEQQEYSVTHTVDNPGCFIYDLHHHSQVQRGWVKYWETSKEPIIRLSARYSLFSVADHSVWLSHNTEDITADVFDLNYALSGMRLSVHNRNDIGERYVAFTCNDDTINVRGDETATLSIDFRTKPVKTFTLKMISDTMNIGVIMDTVTFFYVDNPYKGQDSINWVIENDEWRINDYHSGTEPGCFPQENITAVDNAWQSIVAASKDSVMPDTEKLRLFRAYRQGLNKLKESQVKVEIPTGYYYIVNKGNNNETDSEIGANTPLALMTDSLEYVIKRTDIIPSMTDSVYLKYAWYVLAEGDSIILYHIASKRYVSLYYNKLYYVLYDAIERSASFRKIESGPFPGYVYLRDKSLTTYPRGGDDTLDQYFYSDRDYNELYYQIYFTSPIYGGCRPYYIEGRYYPTREINPLGAWKFIPIDNSLIEAMGINDVRADIQNKPKSIYSLDGRRLQQVPEKGVYIVNGRKMVRK